MAAGSMSHLQMVCNEWSAGSPSGKPVSVEGSGLTISDVVSVALHDTAAQLTTDAEVRRRMDASVDFLAAQLAAGKVIYGVNTGFGGSADTRTQDFSRLQSALVQHLNVGILLPADKGQKPDQRQPAGASAANVDLLLRSHALPPAVVRATMLVRCNSLVRGHSAVRVEIVEALLHMLNAKMTPVVPLRGSISASGDLSTLSYLAGLVEGNPGVYVRCGASDATTQHLPADQALQTAGLAPVRLQAKEGLGITNGTAPSAAAAALAVHTANQMAVWTQLLTAMGTQALAGTAANYGDFVSRARPHRGQSEAAATILAFVGRSPLVTGHDAGGGPARVGLAQDRYALRTAPQWIGPQLEDLALATQQVTTELNSTTDNPLVDVAGGAVHHGGNFQAMAVTSAMEKTLTALQNLGRLLYAQSAELVDPTRSRGLPPNLSPDDPSTSFLCKGFDVNMAAYQAELAYLARPVSTHVQVAEMANQAVNSMALVAARYALEAGEVVSLMVATYLFVLCQALDLRAMRHAFREAAADGLSRVVACVAPDADPATAGQVVAGLLGRWDELAHLAVTERGTAAARDTVGALLAGLAAASVAPERLPTGAQLVQFQDEAGCCMVAAYETVRKAFFSAPAPASRHLSPAARVVYEYIRIDLQIPLHRGLEDHPTLVAERTTMATQAAAEGATNGHANGHADGAHRGDRTRILGTLASDIYVAIRDGRLFDKVVRFCQETKPWEEQ